ncbi:hypothetical protein AB0O51_18440 [Streptomyces sp. NPDC090301]|uniref:hypothetical protein n=1 Tax=Streptomyces sp. NPDC090301 TaxID=3154975 RepID=UPI00341A4050
MWLYTGTGSASPYTTRTRIGAGWGGYDQLVVAGDLTDDGRADAVARDAAGVLWLYKGTGKATSPFTRPNPDRGRLGRVQPPVLTLPAATTSGRGFSCQRRLRSSGRYARRCPGPRPGSDRPWSGRMRAVSGARRSFRHHLAQQDGGEWCGLPAVPAARRQRRYQEQGASGSPEVACATRRLSGERAGGRPRTICATERDGGVGVVGRGDDGSGRGGWNRRRAGCGHRCVDGVTGCDSAVLRSRGRPAHERCVGAP